MTPTLLMVLILAATPSQGAEKSSEAQWIETLEKAENTAAEGKEALQTTTAPEIPGDGAGLRCIQFGEHTEKVPQFDPLYHGCLVRPDGSYEDPLPNRSDYTQALEALVQKLQEHGRDVVNSEGEAQKVRGRGNPDPDGLSESGHWTDLAYLRFRDEDGQKIPDQVTLVTYRAWNSTAGRSTYLKAKWISFTVLLQDGRLFWVESNNGERSPQTGRIMWVLNGNRGLGDLNNMPGVYELYWHQILKAWASLD